MNLADCLIPAEAALADVSSGMQRTRLAGALVSTGIANALPVSAQGARDPVDVARELGLDADVTVRVLEAAVASRLAHMDREGRVHLSRIGAPLRSDHDHSIASWVVHQAAPAGGQSHAQLEAVIREGAEPSGHRRAFDNAIWDHFGEHPDEAAIFAKAMGELTQMDMAALVRAYPWPRRGVICDVGGGVGRFLAAILEHRTAARGVLIDTPQALTEAESFLRARGLSERIERVPGDIFDKVEAQADVFTLKWVLHDWSDERCRGILRRIRATMRPGAKLVVIEHHLDRGRPNSFVSMLDILMMVQTDGGRERSPAELHKLMQDAELQPGSVRHSGIGMLVEGIAR
jgi:hypothetical protein